jgi:hypothetical protein
MAVSDVSLSNMALSELKAERITSMDDGSEEAIVCTLYFDQAMDTLLEQHLWDFAMERATPARLSSTPLYNYDYEFQVPTDPYCLRILEVTNTDGVKLDKWKREGSVILADEDAINIRYIKRVTNLTHLSALFKEAFVFWLASKIAYSLTGSTTKGQDMFQKYRMVMRKAYVNDAKQGAPYKEVDDDYSWIEARFQ